MNKQNKRLLCEAAEKMDNIVSGLAVESFTDKKVDRYPEGQLMKEIRVFIDFPQKEIAKMMGVSAPSLSAHEKRQNVNRSTITKFCQITGIDAWDFDVLRNALTLLKTDLIGLMDDPEGAIQKLIRMKDEMSRKGKSAIIEDINKKIQDFSYNSLVKALDYIRMLELSEKEQKRSL